MSISDLTNPESYKRAMQNFTFGMANDVVGGIPGMLRMLYDTIYGWIIEFLGGNNPPPWRLSVWDDIPVDVASAGGSGASPLPYVPVQGMYAPDNVSFSFSDGLAELRRLNEAPLVQMTSENVSSISFSAKFEAPHDSVDLLPIAAHMTLLREKDPYLGRKPILVFEYAQQRVICIMTGLDVQFGRLFPDGRPAVVTFGITLQKYVPHPKDALDPDAPVPSTSYHTLVGGETIDEVARLYYGDPDMGHALRWANPEITEETPGTVVKIYRRAHPKMDVNVTRPSSVVFDSGWEDYFLDMAQERKDRGESFDFHSALVEVDELS